MKNDKKYIHEKGYITDKISVNIPNGTKLFRDNIRQMSHYDMCTKRDYTIIQVAGIDDNGDFFVIDHITDKEKIKYLLECLVRSETINEK